MTETIDFLEQLGRNARLRHAPTVELKQALAGAGIDPRLRNALLANDTLRLGALLGAQPNVCCIVEKPEPEDDEDKG